MDGSNIIRQFERMGARASIVTIDRPTPSLRLDIARDRRGQLFTLRVGKDTDLRVADVRRDMRHLLLVGVSPDGGKDKFLCGHDEREWFVAGIPGDRGVSNVETAMEALKPPLVRSEQERRGVRHDRRASRRTAAYVRQGEWFFLPRPDLVPDRFLVFRNEPLRRTGGKPHIAEFAYRSGGELVYVSRTRPDGLTESERKALIRSNKAAAQERWTTMRRNAQVYVKGRIAHPDHETVVLPCWHLVQMNTENKAPAMRHIAFLD